MRSGAHESPRAASGCRVVCLFVCLSSAADANRRRRASHRQYTVHPRALVAALPFQRELLERGAKWAPAHGPWRYRRTSGYSAYCVGSESAAWAQRAAADRAIIDRLLSTAARQVAHAAFSSHAARVSHAAFSSHAAGVSHAAFSFSSHASSHRAAAEHRRTTGGGAGYAAMPSAVAICRIMLQPAQPPNPWLPVPADSQATAPPDCRRCIRACASVCARASS